MEQNQPIKVLHILKNIQRGGVEQFLLNQYRILKTKNIRFDFCLYGPDTSKDDAYMIQTFQSMGSRFFYLPYPNKHFLKFRNAFKLTLKEQNYQIVHCHQNLFSGVILPIAKAAQVPVRIAHAHTSKERKNLSVPRKAYTHLMRRQIKRASTHVLGASYAANKFVFGTKEEAEFLPNGIELESFLKVSEQSLRKELGLPSDRLLIGHVGSFKQIKNHPFLLEVFHEYSLQNQNAHLILIGDGEELQKMKEYAETLGIKRKVHFLGNREEIAELLTDLDLFLFPSLFEGLGISLIEAQAAGIRSLASNTIPSEVDLGLGILRFLDLNQPEDWVETIKQLLSEEYTKPSIEERCKIIQMKGFNSESSAERLQKIYEEAIR